MSLTSLRSDDPDRHLTMTPTELASDFALAMDRLGPFEPAPGLAVAVSGGADSMALAILARDWACLRGGTVVALVVDHGLRATSGDEARVTVERLAALGISAHLLPIADLDLGPALAERARTRRYEVLSDACAQASLLHLLAGHQASDQVETLAMRVLRGSGTHGLAGMAALREMSGVRILRPLLGFSPESLRDFLGARAVGWVEDPSNRDQRSLRPRLRHRLGLPSGTGMSEALAATGRLRQREEAAIAAELARRVTIRPEGFALLRPGRIGTEALRSLVGMVGGGGYPPNPGQIADLAANLRPATVAGVRILPAGRLGDDMLVVREEAAMDGPVRAFHGAIWDRRFRLIAQDSFPDGATICKLGDDAARLRRCSMLPSVILRTLPAIRYGEMLASVPHLGYGCQENNGWMSLLFSPGSPAAGAPFVAAA